MNLTVGYAILGVYALLLFMGGVIGYVKARSVPSLVAGTISGVVTLVAFVLAVRADSRWNGFFLGLVVSFLLSGLFLRRFAMSRKLMPSGMLALLSIATVVAMVSILAQISPD